MWEFIANNLIGSLALMIMFYSIALQISYLKFRRKAVESKGKLIDVLKHKFWQLAVIEFDAQDETKKAYSLCVNNKKSPGAEVELYYNPKELDQVDKSIVITPLLKKFNLKKEPKLYVIMKQQNRSLLHMGLIIFSLILLAFN